MRLMGSAGARELGEATLIQPGSVRQLLQVGNEKRIDFPSTTSGKTEDRDNWKSSWEIWDHVKFGILLDIQVDT